MPVIIATSLPSELFYKGKVRDIYHLEKWLFLDLAEDRLLMIATDRISAFDSVLPTGIPNKGKVLTLLSAFWFEKTAHLMPNHFLHLVDKKWLRKPEGRRLLKNFPSSMRCDVENQLVDRAMLVKKARCIPVECVVRGYLSGSAWAEYRQSGAISGFSLPKGLQESQELPQPLFTPTTKAETGHDQPLSMDEMRRLVGENIAEEMREKSLAIYSYAREHAIARGIIIADTKLEFGLDNDKLILIDELLTPDSSRIWDASLYKVGQSQPSYDKQPVRDWLTQSGWNKEPPAPMLPPEVIEATTKRYEQAYQRLTGGKLRMSMDEWLQRVKGALIQEGFSDTILQTVKLGQVFGLVRKVNNVWEMHVRGFSDGRLESEIEISRDYFEHLDNNFRRDATLELMQILDAYQIRYQSRGRLPQMEMTFNPPKQLTSWKPVVTIGALAAFLIWLSRQNK